MSEHRIALVTGTGGGIAGAIVDRLAVEGIKVIAQYRQTPPTVQGPNIYPKQFNLQTYEDSQLLIEQCIQEFSQLDILVNCIGDFLMKPLVNTTPEEFRHILYSNLYTSYDLTHYAFPYLKRSHKPRILNIGFSSAQQITAKPSILPYHMAKMSISLLTKSFAQEGAENNILVNCLSPGIAENNQYPSSFPLPLKRPAKLTEIADAAWFLLSSDYITGIDLPIDGGWQHLQ